MKIPFGLCRSLLIALFAFPALGSFAEQAGGGQGQPPENASNPLAKVSNTDIRWQYLDNVVGEGRVNDVFIDGATMLHPKFKLKYELHYWETDITGSSEHDWESVVLKGIYFPKQGVLGGGWKDGDAYRCRQEGCWHNCCS